MTRPKKMSHKIVRNIYLDADTYSDFEEMIGHGNVSEAIRDLMKKEVERLRKKPEAHIINPLGLPITTQDELVSYISINDYTDKIISESVDIINRCTDCGHLNTCRENIESNILSRMRRRVADLHRKGIFFVNGRLIKREDIEQLQQQRFRNKY